MGSRKSGDAPLRPSSRYRFPTELVGREGQGADFNAFRAEKKINSAEHFDEDYEGRPAMERVASGFFRAVNGALEGMKTPSNKK